MAKPTPYLRDPSAGALPVDTSPLDPPVPQEAPDVAAPPFPPSADPTAGLASSEAANADTTPSLAPQGPQNPVLSFLSRISGRTAAQPEPGKEYTGPTDVRDASGKVVQTQGEGENHALLSFLGKAAGHIGNALQAASGSPKDRALAQDYSEKETEIGSQERLRKAQMAENSLYHTGLLGIGQQKADVAQQNADTGVGKLGVSQQRANIYGDLAGSQEQNLDTKTAKIAYELETLKNGQFPVDPVTAHLVNRPDLAGKAVSAQLWDGFNKVLQARGLHAVDLGADGYWLLDKGGNKVNKISDVSPSISRGAAYQLNRVLPVLIPGAEGPEPGFMKAGDTLKPGAAAPLHEGTQLMSKNAQLGDIAYASGQMRNAIKNIGDKGFDADAIAKMTMAARNTDPTVFQQLKDSLLGSQRLTEPQKDFVVWLQQLHERALSLRNIAGMGNGSDMLRNAIVEMLPSVKSGSTSMANKQLDAFDNQVRILGGGIPKVNSNVTTPTGEENHSGKTTPLTLEEAQQYLVRAGGDKDKARAAAKKDGRSF